MLCVVCEGFGGDEKVLVCDANPHNITLIFNQLIAFIQQIEKVYRDIWRVHCKLAIQITSTYRDIWRVRFKLETQITIQRHLASSFQISILNYL